MFKELDHGPSKGLLPEEDHATQTLTLDASHKSLDVCIQVRRPCRQGDRMQRSENRTERLAELRVAIHEQVPRAKQEAVEWIGHVARDLFHPSFIWVRCATSEMHTAGRDFHDEEQIQGDQPTPGPHLDGGEVDGAEYLPMSLDECLPSGLSLALRSRFNPMCFEDVSDRPVGDLVAQVGQGAFDAIVTPGRILAGHAENEFDDFSRGARPPDLLAAMAVVPFQRDELTVPTEDRVWGGDRPDLAERLAAEDLALDGQATPLVIGEPNALLAVRFLEDLVLGPKVFDELISKSSSRSRPY